MPQLSPMQWFMLYIITLTMFYWILTNINYIIMWSKKKKKKGKSKQMEKFWNW